MPSWGGGIQQLPPPPQSSNIQIVTTLLYNTLYSVQSFNLVNVVFSLHFISNSHKGLRIRLDLTDPLLTINPKHIGVKYPLVILGRGVLNHFFCNA